MDSNSKNCVVCTQSGCQCVHEFHSESEWWWLEKSCADLKQELITVMEEQAHSSTKVAWLLKMHQYLKECHSKMSEHDSNLLSVLDEEDPPSEEELVEFEHLLME